MCERDRETEGGEEEGATEIGLSPFYFTISGVIFNFIRNNSVMRTAFSIFSLINIVH